MTVLCRLCAEEKDETVHIFSVKGQELCLPEKINKCLPVVVSIVSFYVGTVCVVSVAVCQDGRCSSTPCIFVCARVPVSGPGHCSCPV